MKKLELKHLSCYPMCEDNGLIIQTKLRKATKSGKPLGYYTGRLIGVSARGSGVEIVFNKDDFAEDFDLKDIKPILRPLSDLTKIDNKKGIDIISLSRYVDNGHNHEVSKMIQWCGLIKVYTDKCDDIEDIKISFSGDFKNILGISIHNIPVNYNTSLRINQWLLENHFDVFGLIEKGLAIDINTL